MANFLPLSVNFTHQLMLIFTSSTYAFHKKIALKTDVYGCLFILSSFLFRKGLKLYSLGHLMSPTQCAQS